MEKRFVFTMWVYAPINEFTPDEVDMWADCGMTVPMTPKIEKGDDVGLLAPYLDRAEKRGVKLIANGEGIAFDDYQVRALARLDRAGLLVDAGDSRVSERGSV